MNGIPEEFRITGDTKDVPSDVDASADPDIPLRKRYVILLLLLAILFVGVPVGLLAALFLLPPAKFSQEPHHYEVNDPGSDFKHYTGFDWPESARVVSAGEVRLEFLGDGEYYLVFDTDAETFSHWLKQPTPWGETEWRQGPVPAEIPRFFTFGVSGMSASILGTEAAGPIEASQIERLLDSPEVRYAARQRAKNSWNNGEILLLDPVQNRVWYSRWDL
ncbi:hypothetical protein [Gimesia chilikensis]|uniref:hypothetical protein n=1 Tax=Gimesia chilikensis TaxID=2605989 RepID=UPI003A92B4D3